MYFFSFFFRQRQKKSLLTHSSIHSLVMTISNKYHIYSKNTSYFTCVVHFVPRLCSEREVQIFLVIYHHVLEHGVKNTDRSLIFS